MFSHFLSIGLRNLYRNKLTTLINLVGITIAFTVTILIYLFVDYEHSFDSWVFQSERKVRIESVSIENSAKVGERAITPPALAPALKLHFETIEETVRLTQTKIINIVNDGSTKQDRIQFTDNNFLTFFSANVLSGNPSNALANPNNVVLTETIAQKYFGSEYPIGKVLSIAHGGSVVDLQVSAIIQDFPPNSHLNVQFIAPIDSPISSSGDDRDTNWGRIDLFTYAALKEAKDIDRLEASLSQFLAEKVPFYKNLDVESGSYISLTARPIEDIYLYAPEIGGSKAKGNANLLLTFTVIAVIILTVTIVNFVNIQLSLISQRLREVGLRKMQGAATKHIFLQFMIEPALITLSATLISLSVVELILPAFREFVGNRTLESILRDMDTVLLALSLMFGATILAGGYPAYILSRLNPGSIFSKLSGPKNSILRNVLIAVQFAFASFLLISTAVVFLQTQHISNLSRGFITDNVIIARIGNQIPQSRLKAFFDALKQSEAIASVSKTDGLLPLIIRSAVTLSSSAQEKNISADVMYTDENFQDVLQFNVIAGRWFDEGKTADSLNRKGRGRMLVGSVVINESALKSLGFTYPVEAIGQTIKMREFRRHELTVIGVVEDLNFRSATEEIGASIFLQSSLKPVISVLVKPHQGQRDAAVAMLNKTFANFATDPDASLYYTSLKQDFRDLSKGEEQRSLIFIIFSLLTALIACIGLYGMTKFFLDRQSKEIVLRKLFGADARQLMTVLVAKVMRPIGLAFIVSLPIAYQYNLDWLNQFSERISIGVLPFVATGIVVFFISLLTSISLLLRAINQRPTDILRHE